MAPTLVAYTLPYGNLYSNLVWGYCFIRGIGRPRPEIWIRLNTISTPFLYSPLTVSLGDEKHRLLGLIMILITNGINFESPKEMPQSVVIVHNTYTNDYLFILLSHEELSQGIDPSKIREHVKKQYHSNFSDNDLEIIYYQKQN